MTHNSPENVAESGSGIFYKSKDSIPKSTNFYKANPPDKPKQVSSTSHLSRPTLPPIDFNPPIPEDYYEIPPTQIFIRPLYKHDKSQNSTNIFKELPSAKVKTVSSTNYHSPPHRPDPPRAVSTKSVHEDDDRLPCKVLEGGYCARVSENETKRKSCPQPAVNIDNFPVTSDFLRKEFIKDKLAQYQMDWRIIISGKKNDVSHDAFDDLHITEPSKVLKKATKKPFHKAVALNRTNTPRVNGDIRFVQRRKSISAGDSEDQKKSMIRVTNHEKSMFTKEPRKKPVRRKSTIQTKTMPEKSLKRKKIKIQVANGNNGNQDSLDDSMMPSKKCKTTIEKTEVAKVGSNNRVTTRRQSMFAEMLKEKRAHRESVKQIQNKDSSDESDCSQNSHLPLNDFKTLNEPKVDYGIGVTTRRMTMLSKDAEDNDVSHDPFDYLHIGEPSKVLKKATQKPFDNAVAPNRTNTPQVNGDVRVVHRRKSISVGDSEDQKKSMTRATNHQKSMFSKEPRKKPVRRKSTIQTKTMPDKSLKRKKVKIRVANGNNGNQDSLDDSLMPSKRCKTIIEKSEVAKVGSNNRVTTRRQSMFAEMLKEKRAHRESVKQIQNEDSSDESDCSQNSHLPLNDFKTLNEPKVDYGTRRMTMFAKEAKEKKVYMMLKSNKPQPYDWSRIIIRRQSVLVENPEEKEIMTPKKHSPRGITRRSMFAGHPKEKKPMTSQEPGPRVTTRRMSMLAEKYKEEDRRESENDCPCIVTRRKSMSVEEYNKNKIGKTLKMKLDKSDIIEKHKATKYNSNQDSLMSKKFNTPTEKLKTPKETEVVYGTRVTNRRKSMFTDVHKEKKVPKLIKAEPVKTLKIQSVKTKKIEENTKDTDKKSKHQNKRREHSREKDNIEKGVPKTMGNPLPNDKHWRSEENILLAKDGVVDKKKSTPQENIEVKYMSQNESTFETDRFYKQKSVVNDSANGATCNLLENMTLESSTDSESSSFSDTFNLTISEVSNLKIAMTMCPEAYRNLLRRLSGYLWFITNDAKECDVLVAGSGHFTYKMITAIARGIPIVNLKWVDQVMKTELVLVPYDSYIFDDLDFQERHQFNMKKTLYFAKTRSLFDGIFFKVSPHLPTQNIIKDIIVCSGGIVVDYIPRQKWGQQIYFVTSEIDTQQWNSYRKINPNIKCVTTQCVITSVIQQSQSALRMTIC